jgi:poly-beta-1,6-N-acetyl-D-glucosamine N-deacetylase
MKTWLKTRMKKWLRNITCALLMLMLTLPAASNAQSAAVHYSVLCYHDVVDESRRTATPIPMPKLNEMADVNLKRQYFPQTLELSTLVKHFNWLKANGYTPVNFQQILDAQAGKTPLPDKAVLLTFDDGYKSFYDLVYPLLKQYSYPATQALVTSWIDAPVNQAIAYGDVMLPRSTFLTWPQIKEMQSSGLVEIASHTHNHHRSVISNPTGSQQAALLSPQFANNAYETQAAYQTRVLSDLKTSAASIAKNTGNAPRIMVWPYGQFNDVDVALSKQAGFTHHFTLEEHQINTPEALLIGRLLVDEETSLESIAEYLTQTTWSATTQRVVHVDMDYVYDANPAQLNKNLDALIERIHKFGISTVYLQAYSDPDGNGVADALYFPNRHLPVRADLMNRVAWQLMTRAGVSVYAWMPTLAFDLGKGYEYVNDVRTSAPNQNAYLRLSPYSVKSRKAIEDIYQDLGFHVKVDGILFHDDGFLTDFEGPIAKGMRTDSAMEVEAQAKTKDLIDFTHSLTLKAGQYQRGGVVRFKTARNIYASVITDDGASKWFAQDLAAFTKAYDYTAIMAMPYMESETSITQEQANQWLAHLADTVLSEVDSSKVVFELQAFNWRTQQPISDTQMVQWMRMLDGKGMHNFGYYPDNFLKNQPKADAVHPVFSLSTQGRVK